MIQKSVLGWLVSCATFGTAQAIACADHMNFMRLGVFDAAMLKFKGSTPDRVFKLTHQPTTRVAIGEESEVFIDYDRPWRSSNVTLTLTGSRNVEMIDDELPLPDLDGTVRVRFVLTGKGFDVITLVVSGDHQGETVRESSKIFVRASRPVVPPADDVQVSAR